MSSLRHRDRVSRDTVGRFDGSEGEISHTVWRSNDLGVQLVAAHHRASIPLLRCLGACTEEPMLALPCV